jgi:sporulation protein YqfC
MDMSIRAPYNFVPLPDEVYFPDWADQISHYIPFFDGLSGSMELTIKSVTPIFVRNGHTQNDAKSKNTIYKSFSMTNDGKYFIPATTIKGSLRNVLEILTFGKMYHINDKRYSMIYKNNKLNIINYSEILDFSSTLISIRYEDKIYHVNGDNLVISKMIDNEILITGDINNINFK